MSIIQEKIYLNRNSTGATLSFPLSMGSNVSGYQQEINDITEETKQELINPITDYEITRYSYSRSVTTTMSFYFLNSNNTTRDDTFTNAGFTMDELTGFTDVVRNSFFIADFYDTYSANTQTRLFTSYLTKIGNEPIYRLRTSDMNNQFCYFNVPNWAVTENEVAGLVEVYVKFSFYNAKDGKLSLFYNDVINDISDPENMYFKAYLYPQTKTWRFVGATVRAYELSPSSAYVDKVNNTFQNFKNQKQNYPTGNVFEDDGTYDTVE